MLNCGAKKTRDDKTLGELIKKNLEATLCAMEIKFKSKYKGIRKKYKVAELLKTTNGTFLYKKNFEKLNIQPLK